TPVDAKIFDLLPESNSQTGCIRSAEGGGFCDSRANHGNTQDIGLELHQGLIEDHTAVNLKGSQIYAGILVHSFKDFSGLVSGGFQDGTGQVTAIDIAGKTDDCAAGIALPIRSVET